MTRLRRIVFYPIRMGHRTITVHVRLWNTLFWNTWNPLPLHEKLTWIAFVSHTMGILTIFELFFLKRK